jgi:hypothetical protein
VTVTVVAASARPAKRSDSEKERVFVPFVVTHVNESATK